MAFKNFLFTFLVLIPSVLLAQNRTVNSWLTGDLNIKIKKWDFTAEFEYRSIGIFEKRSRLSIQPEVAFNFSKYFKFGSSYAIMSVYDEKYLDYQWRNRFSSYAEGKLKTKRVVFKLREKLEYTTKDESDRIKPNGKIDTYRINPDKIWRNKLKITYDIPKVPVTPSVVFESFYQLNDPINNLFEKLRYSLFLSYKVNRVQEIELFGHLNNDLTNKESGISYIIGIGYTYTL